MVLDSNQFNQLVEEVRKALLADSQGVGDIEIVNSLDDIVSLPALRLSGMEESVVEAPLELLSAPGKLPKSYVRPRRDVSLQKTCVRMRNQSVPLLKVLAYRLNPRVSIRRKTVWRLKVLGRQPRQSGAGLKL